MGILDMISKQLMQYGDNFSERFVRSNAFFEFARQGKIAPYHLAYYINNLICGILSFQKICGYAIDKTSNTKLAAFLRSKKREEAGHEQWGYDDLLAIGMPQGALDTDSISPYVSCLMNYVEEGVTLDPKSLLIYLFFSEYTITLFGPVLLALLDKECNIDKKSLSIIAKHVELDKAHAKEDVAQVDEFYNISDTKRVEQVLCKLSYYVYGFYTDITLRQESLCDAF